MNSEVLVKETASAKNTETKEYSAPEIKLNPDETKASSETTSAEISAKTYGETIDHVTKEFNDVIPKNQLERIEREREESKPTILSSKEYSRRFPTASPLVLGHYDSEGRIYMKEGSSETITHVTTHEAMHLTSYKETGEIGKYRSGIREVVYDEYGTREDNNRALNEGITELYAAREMISNGDLESLEAVNAYPESQRAAYELQGIVGEEVIQKAYFGGDLETLKSEVNRLSYGDETAWDRYSRNADIIEYGSDRIKICYARSENKAQNALMRLYKSTH